MPTLLAVLCLLPAVAAPSSRPLLADFEGGVPGWWTNPWGGGRITVAATGEARFGRQALLAEWHEADGRLSGNLISGTFAPDAPWRQQAWGALSLWYRTAGEQPSFTLSLCRQSKPGEQELSFTASLPASPQWRRLVVEPRGLWNREHQTLDLRQLGRLIIHGSRPAQLWLDQVRLLPTSRAVPLTPYTTEVSLLELSLGRYEVEGPAGSWTATLAVPGATASVQRTEDGDEPVVALAARPTGEGTGRLTIGQSTWQFPVMLPQPEPAIAPLGIFPTPKQLQRRTGTCRLAALRLAATAAPAAARAAEVLRQRLQRECRVAIAAPLGPLAGADLQVQLGEAAPLPLPADLRAEGYTLRVTTSGAAIAARDARGLLHGVWSLLQLLGTATAPGQPAQAPAVEVVDWPDLSVRAVSIPLPTSRWGYPNDAPVPVDFFIDYLDRNVVRHKLNTVILLGLNGVKLASFPKVSSPAAWSKSDFRRVLDFLRQHEVEPIPLLDSLGHADWLGVFHPEFMDRAARRDGQTGQWQVVPDRHTFDTRNPAAWDALNKVLDEVVELFGRPARLHLGHDEVRWQIHTMPKELRGPNDTIDDRAERFADWVTRLHDRFAARGIETMIWTDQLTPGHNGGPPYHTARALARLPRDLWLFNWSSGLAPLHTYEMRSLGFQRVLEANSEGVNRERGQAVCGNVMGLWSKHSWCAETVGQTNEFDWQRLLHSTEYGWRLHPDLSEPKPGTNRAFLRAAADVTAACAWQPEPPGGALVPLSPRQPGARPAWLPAALPPLAARDVTVPLWPGALATGGTVPVGRRVAAIYWAQALDADAAALSALRDGFKDKLNWSGVPAATVRVTYAEQSTVDVPLRFGCDLRERHAAELPGAYGALAWQVAPGAEGDVAVYLRQWVNPHPEREVVRLELTSAHQVLLLGAVARVAAP